jgi:hypothetical protein
VTGDHRGIALGNAASGSHVEIVNALKDAQA